MALIDAHVQLCQRHMCSVRPAHVQCYPDFVQPEQKVIAAWMKRTREKLGWSYKHWAEQSGITPTTLTRAVKDDYPSVTSMETLHALAQAANEPSPLDVLREGWGAGDKPTVAVPNEELLAGLLAAILPLAPSRGQQSARSLRVVGAALQSGLRILEEQIANGEEPALGVASREAVARFRALTQQ